MPSSRLLHNKALSSADSYEREINRLIKLSNTMYGGYRSYFYAIKKNSNIANADPKQLAKVKQFILQHENLIRFRTEDPHIIIYSNDIELLKKAANINSDRLREVSIPKSIFDYQSILDGKEIRSEGNKYQYKLILGGTGFSDKNSIKNIITNSDSGASDGLLRRLDSEYFSGGYLYTNDERIAFLLNIAKPGIVKKIYTLVDSMDKY